mmetsp:Transcript_60522/g.142558  ORF Transcript_60522/g.142558 Transcript_60522/m.142558 type:complete len:402 (-) Transcript_60522:1355-2560(-)
MVPHGPRLLLQRLFIAREGRSPVAGDLAVEDLLFERAARAQLCDAFEAVGVLEPDVDALEERDGLLVAALAQRGRQRDLLLRALPPLHPLLAHVRLEVEQRAVVRRATLRRLGQHTLRNVLQELVDVLDLAGHGGRGLLLLLEVLVRALVPAAEVVDEREDQLRHALDPRPIPLVLDFLHGGNLADGVLLVLDLDLGRERRRNGHATTFRKAHDPAPDPLDLDHQVRVPLHFQPVGHRAGELELRRFQDLMHHPLVHQILEHARILEHQQELVADLLRLVVVPETHDVQQRVPEHILRQRCVKPEQRPHGLEHSAHRPLGLLHQVARKLLHPVDERHVAAVDRVGDRGLVLVEGERGAQEGPHDRLHVLGDHGPVVAPALVKDGLLRAGLSCRVLREVVLR